MKVIFLEDVAHMAHAGETKEVADGYGRNFLIPRNLAVLANSAASNVVGARLKMKARRQAQVEAEMGELAKQLEGTEVVLKARAGTKGRLYGSITSADIADELNNRIGLVVDKKKIELIDPIRELGDYEITVSLGKDIAPKLKVKVVEMEEKEEKGQQGEKAEKEGARSEGKTEEEVVAEEQEVVKEELA